MPWPRAWSAVEEKEVMAIKEGKRKGNGTGTTE